jgi:hemerythrin
MTQQTRAILLRIEALESNVERDVFQFLKEWWLAHIQTADKAYGEYLVETSPNK